MCSGNSRQQQRSVWTPASFVFDFLCRKKCFFHFQLQKRLQELFLLPMEQPRCAACAHARGPSAAPGGNCFCSGAYCEPACARIRHFLLGRMGEHVACRKSLCRKEISRLHVRTDSQHGRAARHAGPRAGCANARRQPALPAKCAIGSSLAYSNDASDDAGCHRSPLSLCSF